MEEWIASAGVHNVFKSLFEELLLSRPDNIPDAVIRYMVNKYPGQTSNWSSGVSSDGNNNEDQASAKTGPSGQIPRGMLSTTSITAVHPIQDTSSASAFSTISEEAEAASSARLAGSDAEKDELSARDSPMLEEEDAEGQNGGLGSKSSSTGSLGPVAGLNYVGNKDAPLGATSDDEEENDLDDTLESLDTPTPLVPMNADPKSAAAAVIASTRRGSVRRKAVSAEALMAPPAGLGRSPFAQPDSRPISEGEDKTPEQEEVIREATNGNLLFGHLDEVQKKRLYKSMTAAEWNDGAVIIQQGDDGDAFYILTEGSVSITVDGPDNVVGTPSAPAAFGELALMYDAPRAATVVASGECKGWKLDRLTYRVVNMDTNMARRAQYEGFLRKVPILESLTDEERLTVADALESSSFADGESIMKQGDPGNDFYIIVEGEVAVFRANSEDEEPAEIARLSVGCFFGEVALLTNRPRTATVVAMGDVRAVKLDRKAFTRVLGSCEDILRRNMNTYYNYVSLGI